MRSGAIAEDVYHTQHGRGTKHNSRLENGPECDCARLGACDIEVRAIGTDPTCSSDTAPGVGMTKNDKEGHRQS